MDLATLGAIVGVLALGGTGVALAKFWMDMGEQKAAAQSALTSAAMAHAKLDLLTTDLNGYKLAAADKFASGHDIIAAEQRFADAVNGLGSRFDAMATRLDRVLESLTRSHV
jgi:hypothetical protein